MQGTPDIFATKGIEYLIVITYLVVLIGFWKLLSRSRAPDRSPALQGELRPRATGWLRVPEGVLFHQGHSWASPESGDVVRVGADDFAMRLLGRPRAIDLPPLGARLTQGERAWEMEVDSRWIPMLSPVDGEVIAINRDLKSAPELASDEPFDRGWLLKVRVPNARANLKNLLSGRLAKSWMEETVERLRAMRAGELGIVMPDGGIPVDGFARILAPERWDEVAREFLLSD